jgi:hypothetical protein
MGFAIKEGRMSSLYQIEQKYLEAISSWDDSITDEEFGDMMFEISGEFKDKVENIVYFIRNNEADIKSIDDEIARLKARRDSKANRNKKLSEYMKVGMETMMLNKLTYDKFDVKIQRNPPKIIVLDESKIPAMYKTEKVVTTTQIDKAAIKAASGCDGCEIVQETRVVIK